MLDPVANELRLAAYAADDAFQAELVRVYGKRAGDMRYQPNDFEDAALIKAHEAKRAADEAMHAARATELHKTHLRRTRLGLDDY
jgi:hypothetical protein